MVIMDKPLKNEVEFIAKALQEYYLNETPPPTEVLVDVKTIRPDKLFNTHYCAKVTLVTDYIPGKTKTHVINIRFKLSEQKKVIGNSIGYL